MLSRARRIVRDAKAEPFRWAAVEDVAPTIKSAATAAPRAGRAEPAAAAPSPEPPPPPAPEPAAPPPPAIDQEQVQRRLAELEREAFTKGYAAGEQAGLEAGTTRSDGMLRRLGQTIEEVEGLRPQIIAETERQMVQIALAVARRILRREVSVDQDLIVAISRVALDRLGDTAVATIRLNPDDYAAVTARHGGQWAGARVTVSADAGVSRGGCRVESDLGFIEAGIDAQFDQLVHALLGDGEAAPVAAVSGGADANLLADPVS
jgi:flagellar assembly protein FliH